MSIAFFEHHAYPSAYLRAYLGRMRKEGYAGGVECAFLYLFYMQHLLLPQNRNEEDILLLRAAIVSSDQGFRGQLQDSADIVDGLSNTMVNTPDKLEEECSLPSLRAVQN